MITFPSPYQLLLRFQKSNYQNKIIREFEILPQADPSSLLSILPFSLCFDLCLILLNRHRDFLGHILLIMLSKYLIRLKVAAPAPRLLRDGGLPRNRCAPCLIVGEGGQKAVDDDGVAFPEKIGEHALVPDEDVGEEIGDDELHLLGGGGVGEAALEDEATEAEAALVGVFGELLEGVSGGDVEDHLFLEGAEDDDEESGDAGEGEAVVPEAAVVDLAGAGADVDGAAVGAAEGGEVAEEEGGWGMEDGGGGDWRGEMWEEGLVEMRSEEGV